VGTHKHVRIGLAKAGFIIPAASTKGTFDLTDSDELIKEQMMPKASDQDLSGLSVPFAVQPIVTLTKDENCPLEATLHASLSRSCI